MRPRLWNAQPSFWGFKRKLKARPRVCVITQPMPSRSATVVINAWLLLKECCFNLSAVHKTWLVSSVQYSSVKLTTSAYTYWKLFICHLTCCVLNMIFLLNFLNPKSISATFFYRKGTNGCNSPNSHLTQTKLIIC